MSAPIISVENLGKKYQLNHLGQRRSYTALRDVVADKARRIFRSPFARRSESVEAERSRTEEFWALQDVSFEVQPGEVLGIIGRNGAGKSTLLKILSRITEPSTGSVSIRGRVASLLEVGTGFHPELTGRDNIFLNGAILGMKRAEIQRKFDEIVAFAEVEKFLDTPVKHYSSGMYVRLAFAVAAHLEPEILVVDEVLAVGDAEFQKKCLGKMQDVSKGGRTVLFVSHNMAIIQALCPKTLLLHRGQVKFIGTSAEAALEYLASEAFDTILERAQRPDGTPTITRVELSQVESSEDTVVHFNMEVRGQPRKRCSIEVKISDGLGVPIGLGSMGLLNPGASLDLHGGVEEWLCSVRLPRMARGKFRLSVQLANPMVEVIDSTGDGLWFEVNPLPLIGYTRVLEQSWGYGAFELPFEMRRKTPVKLDKENANWPYEMDTAARLTRH